MILTHTHTHTHTDTHTHTHTQDKGSIECSVVTALHNKGKLELPERESTQPRPKSSWNWTFDSSSRGCLCEIVTSIRSNKTADCIHASSQSKRSLLIGQPRADGHGPGGGCHSSVCSEVYSQRAIRLHRHCTASAFTPLIHTDIKGQVKEEAVYICTPH